MMEKNHKKEKFVGILLDQLLFFVKNVPCLRNLKALCPAALFKMN